MGFVRSVDSEIACAVERSGVGELIQDIEKCRRQWRAQWKGWTITKGLVGGGGKLRDMKGEAVRVGTATTVLSEDDEYDGDIIP
jgi:hypothetical protein